ncbi:MAG: family 10 glycosylhydrolase [Chitinophagaceae bacterium]|nr:family 10 glycosylhydrolase [Chitinophagaceae bacterium]
MDKVLCFIVCVLFFTSSPAQRAPWWQPNNLRVIQVNLPDYEAATLHPDSLVKDLETYSANTVIINAGGIMAFYPTKLPFHYINPYMKPNMLGDVVKNCHEKNIKVIVRFDFSRAHESIFKAHPDWFYISPDGERIINTNMYAVSINGPYVQQRAFDIISEVLDLYPIDGIFLNMPGYQTRNAYAGKYHGIDQNEYDEAAFKKFSGGKSLPVREDRNDPVFQEYLLFKKQSVEEWSKRLYELVHKKSNQIAICTYSDKYVDIIRHEAQTNSLPYWPYTSSDNVNNAVNSYPGHIISNASIQQISFQSRYNAIEPEEISIRLYENIANGSGLDLSLMGDMRGYEDERNYPAIKKIYAFHKQNEKWFGNYSSLSDVAVIAPGSWPSGDPMQEYRGMQLMLKESHIQYDIIEDAQVANLEKKLERYKVIIVPDITYLGKAGTDVLKRLCSNGAAVIATNRSFSDDTVTLREMFGATAKTAEYDGAGNYLQVDDRSVFKRLPGQKMVFWKFNLGLYDFENSNQKFLPILGKGRPGPPEIIGGHDPTGFYAAASKKYGRGTAMLVPVNIGKLYFIHGYEQYKNIVLDLINQLYPPALEQLKTNAHERVEIIAKNFGNNQGAIVHFVNITGFSGNTYFKPLPVSNISVKLRSKWKPRKAFLLSNKKALNFTYSDGYVSAVLPALNEFEAIVFEQ